MKLSEYKDYQTAVFASVNGELSQAREAYQRLLEEAEGNDDDVAISFLMQSLANVEARDGNLELGHELHLRAIGQSQGVPFNLIVYAKSLINHFAQPELAEQKLVEAETLINKGSRSWRDDMTPEQYAQEIEEVRSLLNQEN